MFPSKQKTIKNMFSSDKLKKVEKVISKFFLINEGICHSKESRGIREANDDGGEDVRVLFSSNSGDGEDGDDDYDGGGDNNGGNNGADRETYNLEGHMQVLNLTSSQHYGLGYGYDHIPQLDRSSSTILISLLIAWIMIMMILCLIAIQ